MRQILGLKGRGVLIDPLTGQSIVRSKHSGDITYQLIGDTAISEESEFIKLTRERILNPIIEPNLNEVGEDKNIITRVKRSINRD